MKKKTIYLIDFDGTITKQDTLDYIAKKFYPEKYNEWGKKIMNGEFSIMDWIMEFEKTFSIDEETYINTLNEIEIDEYFENFIKDKNVVIVSGGFTYNIKHILEKHGIKGIKIYASGLEFIAKNRIKIILDYYNHKLPFAAVCKEDILERYKKDYENIVYIGDGITDLEVSKLANVIYAKKGQYLEKKLLEAGIEHKIFKNFSEIK